MLLQRLVHPRPELVHQHRLGEVVDGTVLQAVHRRLHLRQAGEHDHDGVGPLLPQRPEEGDPVHPGHLDVGDDQRDLAQLLEERQRLLAVARLAAGDSEALHHPRDRPPHQRFVVHHQAANRGAPPIRQGARVGLGHPVS